MSSESLPAQTSPSESGLLGRSGPRSRAGCWTCREKKVKCDEQRPQCRRCVRLDLTCDYQPRPRKQPRKRRSRDPRPLDDQQSMSQDSSPADAPSGRAARVAVNLHHATEPRNNAPDTASDIVEDSPGSSLGYPDSRSSVPTGSQSLVSDTCAAILGASDYQAIYYFRFVLAPSIDNKDPELSTPAIIWKLGQADPMVLHMICALGSQESCYDQDAITPGSQKHRARKARAVEHYGAGLSLLATATGAIQGHVELDSILATLWLMIVYEQKFGDGCGSGLAVHLRGAASVIQGRLHNLEAVVDKTRPEPGEAEGVTTTPGTHSSAAHGDWLISAFTARMITWISFLDGAATLNGVGGNFNELLSTGMYSLADDNVEALLRGFFSIQRYSNFAASQVFHDQYNQQQLLEDLENRQMFYLYAHTGQLRYLLAKLLDARDTDPGAYSAMSVSIAHTLAKLQNRYGELINVAGTLRLDASCCHRVFVANIRYVVAYFHAVVLCFYRIIMRDGPWQPQQRTALQELLKLAHQSHEDEGLTAVLRLAWPLFVAALESDDSLHRSWILEQYQAMANKGENYRRANVALKHAFTQQRLYERRIDLFSLLRMDSLEKFVI